MKKLSLFIFILIASGNTSALADSLICQSGSGGWQILNLTKNMIIASSSFYYELEACKRAIATKIDSGSGFGIVCGPKNGGSAIFRLDGTIVGNPDAYFNALSFCEKALRASRDWVVCTPKNTGSSPFDLRTGRWIGPEGSFYYSVDYCQWASLSALGGDKFVCSVDGQEGTAIFERSTNRLSSNRHYDSAKDCHDEIRGAAR